MAVGRVIDTRMTEEVNIVRLRKNQGSVVAIRHLFTIPTRIFRKQDREYQDIVEHMSFK